MERTTWSSLDGPNSHPQVELKPLEDQTAKDANGKTFDEAVPFNQNDARITEENKKALSSLWEAVMNQTPVRDEDFDKAVTFATDPIERKKLKSDLKVTIDVWMRRIAGAYVRNTWIAKNIISVNENIAVVVGYSHLDNLVKQTISECQKSSK